ncbi:OpgC domain-containing protein [Amaricoccus sp. W119]|uniref:OpgC domain-containing protein n=1 Tax=Amaricoccus sp. W119 TaxID=3391833 RepID=UPI0039A42634
MRRYEIFDGFRGFFLIFMAIAHFDGLLRTWVGVVHHKNFGWVEDAQGFVFLSGLVAGMVYGRRFLAHPSVREAFGRVFARARQIYAHQVTLILLALGAAFALGTRAPVDFQPYLDAPVTFTAGSLLLVSSSANMGILPMYIVFLLVTPFAMKLLHRDMVAPYFALVILAWLAAQTSLTGKGMYALENYFIAEGIPARFGLFFNMLGWQALFFSGLFVGFRFTEGRLNLDFLDQPQFRVTFFIALGGMTLLGIFDLIVEFRLLGEGYTERMLLRSPRAVLGVVYPIAFLIDLFIVVWLLRNGATDPLAWIRRLSAGVNWFFTRPALVLLGRHSLHVFTFHIIVYYALAALLSFYSPSPMGRELLLVAGIASLYLCAASRSWWLARARPATV